MSHDSVREETVEKIKKIFPHIQDKKDELFGGELDLVHYTSARNAVNIISSNEIWMRSIREMNDVSELRHGQFFVQKNFNHDAEVGKKLWRYLDNLDESIKPLVDNAYTSFVEDAHQNTYMAFISEHDRIPKGESDLGRLSMWRAYGGQNGVALVFNKSNFFKEPDFDNSTNNLPLVIYPALYWKFSNIDKRMSELTDNLIDQLETLRDLPAKNIANLVNMFLYHFVYCLKHEAFQEEREWRIIHRLNDWKDSFLKIDNIYSDSVVINDVPQIVHKIPFRDKYNTNLNQILKKIIIGPSNSSRSIARALENELEKADINDVEVLETLIPLK